MPLAHQLFTPDGGEPSSYVLFLHGILGTGGNLRTIARNALAGTGRGALLVDLRMHGRSQGFPPPHTVAAAAADLSDLSERFRIDEVVGHSFGGKVALAYLEHAAAAGSPPEKVFLLDSSLGARPTAQGSTGTLAILDLLDALPRGFPSRDAFLQHLRAQGVAAGVADWLAMNLARSGDAYSFALDLGAIRALIDDYLRTDAWSLVETPPRGTQLVVVAGGRSDALAEEDLTRVRSAAAHNGGQTSLFVLPDAGHWVHVDAPGPLVQILRGEALSP